MTISRVLTMAVFSRVLFAQAMVACFPSTPLATQGERIEVTAATDAPKAAFAWAATTGTFANKDRGQTTWQLPPDSIGVQTARVEVIIDGAVAATCSLTLQVISDIEVRDALRTSGLAFLTVGRHDREGFGLYSYLVFGTRPREVDKDRYRAAIEACLTKMPAVFELHRIGNIPLRNLNATFVPVKRIPPSPTDPVSILDSYDYATAKVLISNVPGTSQTGLYLISSSVPLLSGNSAAHYLVQDLSHVPTELMSTWLDAFINQTAQERFWEERTMPQLALKLRLSIAILAEAFPPVSSAVQQWIKVVK